MHQNDELTWLGSIVDWCFRLWNQVQFDGQFHLQLLQLKCKLDCCGIYSQTHIPEQRKTHIRKCIKLVVTVLLCHCKIKGGGVWRVCFCLHSLLYWPQKPMHSTVCLVIQPVWKLILLVIIWEYWFFRNQKIWKRFLGWIRTQFDMRSMNDCHLLCTSFFSLSLSLSLSLSFFLCWICVVLIDL